MTRKKEAIKVRDKNTSLNGKILKEQIPLFKDVIPSIREHYYSTVPININDINKLIKEGNRKFFPQKIEQVLYFDNPFKMFDHILKTGFHRHYYENKIKEYKNLNEFGDSQKSIILLGVVEENGWNNNPDSFLTRNNINRKYISKTQQYTNIFNDSVFDFTEIVRIWENYIENQIENNMISNIESLKFNSISENGLSLNNWIKEKLKDKINGCIRDIISFMRNSTSSEEILPFFEMIKFSQKIGHGWTASFMERVHFLEKFVKSIGTQWAIADDMKTILICARPSKIHLTPTFRLHNESGPAIEYADGTKIWAMNGVILPENGEKIIMTPELQTIEEINKETNNDIRSIRLERFGILKYIEQAGAKHINSAKNEIEGTRECLVSVSGGIKKFIATCPTGRIVCLDVHPDTKTCKEARESFQGNNSFKVLART